MTDIHVNTFDLQSNIFNFKNKYKILVVGSEGQRLLVFFNPLKPTGRVMHEQFNIQQLYALPTLYLCVLYLSENKQRLVPLTA